LNKKQTSKSVVLTLFITTLFCFEGLAQKATSAGNSVAIPLSNSYTNYFESEMNKIDSTHFTSIRPFISADISLIIDSLNDTKLLFQNHSIGWIGRKLFNEDLVTISGDDFSFNINPIVNFSIGNDNQWVDKTPYFNTRGVRITGNILSKFTFETEFLENQALLPRYVTNFANAKRVLPNYGGFKSFDTLNAAKDFSVSTGSFAYRPNRYFHFQFGHGKHFWGDGYRSLLLSDNAPSYPYFRLTTTFWKIRYVNLWAQMLDNNRPQPDGTFTRKFVSSHLLSWNVSKRLNIGFFETIVYHDTTGTRGFDLQYLNPIIFYRPLEFALGSDGGNALLGLNLKYKITNNKFIYCQFILDEFNGVLISKDSWTNKFGYQVGIKSFNTFIPNLTVQTEINMVRPYTYSHLVPTQNYGHFNQPLAHPLGSNFREWVTNIRYTHKRILLEGRLMIATQGQDSLIKNYGSNIFRSYYDNLVNEVGVNLFQGIKTQTLFGDIKIGYLVNPKTNLRLELGMTVRRITPEIEVGNLKAETTKYFYFGLKTDLYNQYHDF
jgi:hypothetical protein